MCDKEEIWIILKYMQRKKGEKIEENKNNEFS